MRNKWTERFQVDSRTSDATHVVGVAEDGTWGCNCQRWKSHRAECKRAAEVKMGRAAMRTAVKKSAQAKRKPPTVLMMIFERPRRMIRLEDD